MPTADSIAKAIIATVDCPIYWTPGINVSRIIYNMNYWYEINRKQQLKILM